MDRSHTGVLAQAGRSAPRPLRLRPGKPGAANGAAEAAGAEQAGARTAAEPGRTGIFLIERNALLRDGLRAIFDTEQDLAVVGDAGDLETALEQIARCRPDVVVLGVESQDEETEAMLQRLAAGSPGARVILLSQRDGPRPVERLLALGVRGYLLKSMSRSCLTAMVAMVSSDDTRSFMAVPRTGLATAAGFTVGVLSERECQVMELVAQAKTNAQIARQLEITEGTVKRHLRNVFSKLQAVSRIDAVNKAIIASLIEREAAGSEGAARAVPEQRRNGSLLQRPSSRS